MADDTRQPKEDLSKEALTVDPNRKSFSGNQWKDAPAQQWTKPPENANMLAGGTQNTAGGKIPEVSIGNAFEGGLKWNDFAELPKKPCVRDSLMTGIGAGFAFGGVRAIFGASVWQACSWAVGSVCFGSAGMYQWCLHRRQAEKDGMMRAVEILNKKDLEKKAREQRKEAAKQERRKAKEEEQEVQFAALREAKDAKTDGAVGRPFWKFW